MATKRRRARLSREFFQQQGRRGGQLGGQAGGRKRVAALTPEERSALARRAALARWRKHRAKPKRRRS